MKYLVIFDNGDLIMSLGVAKSYVKALGFVMKYLTENYKNFGKNGDVKFHYFSEMEGDTGEIFDLGDDERIYILYQEEKKDDKTS